jgi:hypothetical protein
MGNADRWMREKVRRMLKMGTNLSDEGGACDGYNCRQPEPARMHKLIPLIQGSNFTARNFRRSTIEHSLKFIFEYTEALNGA